MNEISRNVQVDIASTIQKQETYSTTKRLYTIYDSELKCEFNCVGSGTELDPIRIVFSHEESYTQHLLKLRALSNLASEKSEDIFISVVINVDGQPFFDCIVTSDGAFYLKYTARFVGEVNLIIQHIQYFW